MASEPDLSLPGKASGPADMLHAQAVFLVGFMGSGKTTVGSALAQLLQWRFQDLDDYIQQREGRAIADIFKESGEAEFRGLERAAIQELVAQFAESFPAVVALGGGAFAQPEIASMLREAHFPIIFLDAPVEELWRRCEEAVARPMKRDLRQFRQLYENRRPHYLQATAQIDTQGKEVEAIAAEIAARFELRPAAKEK
jgi:shikimate kinase